MARKKKTKWKRGTNPYRSWDSDDLFFRFQALYKKWGETKHADPELIPLAEQLNLSYLCLDDYQKEWLYDKFVYYGGPTPKHLSEVGKLWKTLQEFDSFPVATWKIRYGHTHPLLEAPMVPDLNQNPGPWFKYWAENNPRHWWALCRLEPQSEQSRMQQRILDCGSLSFKDMAELWNLATRLELKIAQNQKEAAK